MVLQKGTKQQKKKILKTLRTSKPAPQTARKSTMGPKCVFRSASGHFSWRWMVLPSLGMPVSGSSNEGIPPTPLRP